MKRWSEDEQAQGLRDFVRDLVDKPAFTGADAIAISKTSNMFRVRRLATNMVNQYGTTVFSGPFKGMRLVPVQLGSLLMPRILGSYESELAPIFSDLSRFNRLVDVGSAEGYYAVGCPFANPHLRTIAFDTDERVREVCGRAAALNGVADRVEQRGLCAPDDLAELATPDTLILVDIDGGETDLLCGASAAKLARAEIVVEVHHKGSGTTETDIIPHFAATHDITVIRQSVVDAWQFEMLRDLSSFERFLAVWEGRYTEAWLHMRPRG